MGIDEKNQEIWAEVKFVPADPKRKTTTISTKKTKFQKIINQLKKIWRYVK
jgi:hypothetical protein